MTTRTRRPRPGRRGPRRLAVGAGVAMLATLGVGGPAAAAADPHPAIVTRPAAAADPGPALHPAPLPDVAPTDPSTTPLGLVPAGRDGDGVRIARGTGPLKLVAVTWTGAAPDAVELRSTGPDGRYSTWTPMDLADSERDGAPTTRTPGGGTTPIWVGDQTTVEVRATDHGRPFPGDLSVLRIDPGTSPNDAAIGRAVTGRAAAAPTFVTRAQWGADPKLMTWPPQTAAPIRAATVHHTSTSSDYGPADSAGIVRGIYYYHSVTNGWGDIGYNALVDKYGTIFEGRDGGLANPVVGAHAGGFNTNTFGVSMIGNYQGSPPTAATVESVSRLAAWKLGSIDPYSTTTLTSTGFSGSKYPRPGDRATLPALFGHRDVGQTECPGDAGYATLGAIRDRTRALERAGGTATGPAPTPPPATQPPAGQPATPTPAKAPTRPPSQAWGPGAPFVQEGATIGNRGWFNDYGDASVYWSPTTGSWEIYGDLRAWWGAHGWEGSSLGYPTSNEYDTPGGRQQNFEHGVLRWTAATRAVTTVA